MISCIVCASSSRATFCYPKLPFLLVLLPSSPHIWIGSDPVHLGTFCHPYSALSPLSRCNSRRHQFLPSSVPHVFDDLGSSIRASKMHKISNITGQARHGWERMAPAGFGGMSRIHQDMPNPQPLRRPPPSQVVTSQPSSEPTPVHLSFNIPFSYSLPGPERDEVIHSSPGALNRWTCPADTAEGTATHKLPVHVQNEERLRTLCQYLSDQTGGRIRATVTSSEPKTGPVLHRKSHSLVTNVCVSGDGDLVYKIRARILNETPIMMVRLLM
jgi:hypothetical protein